MLGPQGCECPEVSHLNHKGHICGVREFLFPIGRTDEKGKMRVHWACEWCYRQITKASPGTADFVPLGNMAA